MKKKLNKVKTLKQGFTLLELLVVVLIIGILAAIALPQYEKSVERAHVAEAQTMLKAMFVAQQECTLRTGDFNQCNTDKFWDNSSFQPPAELTDECLDTAPCFKTQYWEYWSDDILSAGRVKNNELVALLGSDNTGNGEVLDIFCLNITNENYCQKIGM